MLSHWGLGFNIRILGEHKHSFHSRGTVWQVNSKNMEMQRIKIRWYNIDKKLKLGDLNYFFYCCSSTVVPAFPPPPSLTAPMPTSHPQSYPPLALSLGPLYTFLDDSSPSFPRYCPHSGYCQFTLYFNVSGCILFTYFFCCLVSTNRWDHIILKHNSKEPKLLFINSTVG